MTPLTPAAPVCTEACWTPVSCPTCGRKLTPRGRSAPLECFSDCCEEHRNSTLNKRHLWDEHDSTRIHALIAEVRRLREQAQAGNAWRVSVELIAERDAALAERDELVATQKSDYCLLLDAWRERGDKVPGASKQSVVQRVVLGIHELRESRDAALAEARNALHLMAAWGCRDVMAHEEETCALCRAEHALEEALAERDHARAALQAVEWTSLDPFFIETPQCPWCLSYEKEGHAPDCARQAALGRGEEE